VGGGVLFDQVLRALLPVALPAGCRPYGYFSDEPAGSSERLQRAGEKHGWIRDA